MWRGDEDTWKANFLTPWFCLCVDPGTVPLNASSTKLAWPPSSPITSRLCLHFVCPSVTVSPHFMHTSLPPNVSYLREAGTLPHSSPSFWGFRTLLIIVLNNSCLNWVKTNQTESHGGQIEHGHFWYEENGLSQHRKASSRNSTAQPSVNMCSIWPSVGLLRTSSNHFLPNRDIPNIPISCLSHGDTKLLFWYKDTPDATPPSCSHIQSSPALWIAPKETWIFPSEEF